jgi:hypothetical protein
VAVEKRNCFVSIPLGGVGAVVELFLRQYYSYLMESFPDSAERQHTRLAEDKRTPSAKSGERTADITIKSTRAQVKQINFNYRKKNRAECTVENLYM